MTNTSLSKSHMSLFDRELPMRKCSFVAQLLQTQCFIHLLIDCMKNRGGDGTLVSIFGLPEPTIFSPAMHISLGMHKLRFVSVNPKRLL